MDSMKIIVVVVIGLCATGAPAERAGAQTVAASTLPHQGTSADACPNVEAYGGSTSRPDNSAALAAALAASPGDGRCAYVPPGRFAFASTFRFQLPSATASVTLAGAGADTSQLYWADGGGLVFDYVGPQNSVHLREMSLTTGAAGIGAAVALNQTAGTIPNPANTALSDLFDVTIRGADGYAQADYWGSGVAITRVSNVNLVGLVVTGPGAAYSTHGVGLSLSGSASDPSVVYNVTDATFNYLSRGIVYEQQVQGLTVAQSNFTGDEYGIYVPSGLTGLDQLTVLGSQFNCANGGIYVGSYVSNTLISANLFIVPNTGTGVQLEQAYLYSVVGNAFNIGSPAKGASHPIGIEVGTTVGGGIITGNLFDNMVAAIVLDPRSTAANVQSNKYSNVSTTVRNLGNGNTIGGGSP